MGRKYGQRGYMEGDRDREKPRQQPKKPKEFRAPQMPGFQEVLRCSLCGAIVTPAVTITFETQCPKCKADLYSCKNCRHFDTSARFECTQPIPERIPKKGVRNACGFFEARKSIERETSSGNSGPGGVGPGDARSAFENLFKK